METVSQETIPGLLLGTVTYMAPEQLESRKMDARTDIYALGLVLYEMAAGDNPFVGNTASSTIANILKEDAPPIQKKDPTVPTELDRILLRCLRKHPEERYQAAQELLMDLHDLRSSPVGAQIAELRGIEPSLLQRLFQLC